MRAATWLRSCNAIVVVVVALGACQTRPRTEIMLRIDTDMTQGQSATLSAVRIRVWSESDETPRFERRFELGAGEGQTFLPAELGLVPASQRSALVRVEVDALRGDTVMFSHSATARYVPEQTLLLEAFLAERCRLVENQTCPANQTCGRRGCEAVERMSLPPYQSSADAGFDGGACNAMCNNKCADLNRDATNCGACGNDCTRLPHVVASGIACIEGQCSYPPGACDKGFAHCSPNPESGCETDSTAPANCGMCGNACKAPTPLCAETGAGSGAYACAATCPSALTECSAMCVDTQMNAMYCGSCTNMCTAPLNANPSCSMGSCGWTCRSGYHRCPGPPEVCADNNSPATCGTRCTPCAAAPANARVSCDGTDCGFICDPGFTKGATACTPGPAVNAPRPIAPLSGGQLTTKRPTFRWELAGGTDGVRLEICRDRACTMILLVYEAGASATSLRIPIELGELGSRLYYFRLFGRQGASTGSAPSAVWSFEIAARSAMREAAWGTVADFEGDGFADLAVGTATDKVLVYRGSMTGITFPSSVLLQGAGGSEFSKGLAAAGDVDGDGFMDLLAGAPAVARAYLHRGGGSGLAMTGAPVDGPASSGFGSAVAAAGDVNGDGYADVIIGAPTLGAAYLYYGTGTGLPTNADVTLSGPGSSGFGRAVAGVGDVNGDGYSDFAIGAPDGNSVYVYYGQSAKLPATLTAVNANASLTGPAGSSFGASVAGAGDINGDGFPDILVGSPAATAPSPGVRLYSGAAAGVNTSVARAWPYPGAASTHGYGKVVAPAGDVNGDGYCDFLVGAPDANVGYGYLGSTTSGELSHARSWAGSAGSLFASSMRGPGDINHDGFDDVAGGAPGSKAILVYLNSAAGFNASGTARTEGTETGFGGAIARQLLKQGDRHGEVLALCSVAGGASLRVRR
jgi:hypothetical protein